MIFAEVRRGKALADAVQHATITDASGNTLDINELFGVEEVDEAEATATAVADDDPAAEAGDQAASAADRAGTPEA